MLIIEIAIGIVLGVIVLALLPALLAVAIRIVPWLLGIFGAAFLLVKALQWSWADWKLGFELVGCGVVLGPLLYWFVGAMKRRAVRAAARRATVKPSGWRWERAMKRQAKRRAALGYEQ